MKFFAGVIVIISIAALLDIGMISAQTAHVSAQANLAQGIANAAANGAIMQAQCLAGLFGFLGLAAGILLGVILYNRYLHSKQINLMQEQMRLRAFRQPRHSNGRFSQRTRRSQPGVQIQASYLPQGAQPYIILMPNRQQHFPSQIYNQQPGDEIFIMQDEADADLDLWGF